MLSKSRVSTSRGSSFFRKFWSFYRDIGIYLPWKLKCLHGNISIFHGNFYIFRRHNNLNIFFLKFHGN